MIGVRSEYIFVRSPILSDGEDLLAKTETGTLLSPFTSLTRALSKSRLGHHIILLPGTYPPLHVAHVRGTKEHPVTIQGLVEKGGVCVDGANFQTPDACCGLIRLARPLIHVVDSRWVRISDIRCRTGYQGVQVDRGCFYVTVARIECDDVTRGIKIPYGIHHQVRQIDCNAKERPKRCLTKLGHGRYPHRYKYYGWVYLLTMLSLLFFLSLVIANKLYYQAKESHVYAYQWVISAAAAMGVDVFFTQPFIHLVLPRIFACVLGRRASITELEDIDLEFGADIEIDLS
eukprot:NODE_1262_length_1806_cov_68.508616_g1197_i0.p1 GENE.NODE_1262_length_1806_cov_68.508616_g1197_i0~~NODE_1262_length_1806_cov_68.508616_g1197_i0.p1  ORF type:complete len:288 (-),score=16.04 NODE_1262_length_1806_cov_68.508616_g1197_i0:265-1128(-)